MVNFSTRQAAQKLGLAHNTLAQYVRVGKVPPPRSITSGGTTVHIWTEEEIEHVRQLLPKIANGRKTRYKKKQSAVGTRQSGKTKAQAGVPVPHKKKQPKKKKRT